MSNTGIFLSEDINLFKNPAKNDKGRVAVPQPPMNVLLLPKGKNSLAVSSQLQPQPFPDPIRPSHSRGAEWTQDHSLPNAVTAPTNNIPPKIQFFQRHG